MPAQPIGRTGPLPRTAWRDRARVMASAAGVSLEGLGELVEAELTRLDGVLFTATPTEDLDEISRWARLADAAWCGQVRAIVAAHNRMTPAEREFLACEVSLALNLSDSATQDLIATGLLAAALPGLVEAVEAGMLTVRHVYAVLGALTGTGLGTEERHAVVLLALARYQDHTPAQLGALVAKLVLTVNPDAASARETDATYRRQVRFRAIEDGQGLLTARGPLAVIEAMRAALHAGAAVAEPGDERTQDAREFDLLLALVTGEASSADGGWIASIVIPYSTASGADVELAEIPGLGPVLPETARDLLIAAQLVQRIAVDARGRVLEISDPLPRPANSATDSDPLRWLQQLAEAPLRIGIPTGTSSYRPTDRLRRFVQARDRRRVLGSHATPPDRRSCCEEDQQARSAA